MVERKNTLILAALSDMAIIGTFQAAPSWDLDHLYGLRVTLKVGATPNTAQLEACRHDLLTRAGAASAVSEFMGLYAGAFADERFR